MSNDLTFSKRRTVIVCMMMAIAAMHIINPESYLKGDLSNYYYSYFSDLVLPFGCYFLLRLMENQVPILRRWAAKLAIAFMIPSIAETCQYFGIPVLGSTFDLLDYCMYGVGTISAALVDTQVFPRIFSFWKRQEDVAFGSEGTRTLGNK
jgi:hypothetical protein